jgi:hypothetical protein
MLIDQPINAPHHRHHQEMIIMAQFTTTEVAEKFDTNTRTLRKFLRADAKANGTADALPGKGSRYAIEGKQLAPLKKRFATWQVAQAEERAARAAKAVEDAKVADSNE